MNFGQGLRLIVLGAALLLPATGLAKISQEIFATKANKFAEQTFHERLTFSPKLKADPQVIEALKNVWPDNRLLPAALKSLPVVEVSGGEHLLSLYTKAKAWFSPTIKTFVKVARGQQAGHAGDVLFIGFADAAAPLISEELDRIAAGASNIDAILAPKLAKLAALEQRLDAKLKAVDADLQQEAKTRASVDEDLHIDAMAFGGGAAILALIALLGLMMQTSARKKSEALLKTQLEEKGGEPSSYLKL